MIHSLLVFSLFFASSTAIPQTSVDNPHPWIPAGPGDSRAPCPVLNTLANHGYLPRDGKNVTPAQLNSTIQDILGLEPSLADIIASKVHPITQPDGTIELHDLALHGFIEHDASLSKDDANGAVYAPVTINPQKVAELFTFSSDGVTLTIDDWAHIRVMLESREPAPLTGDPLLFAAGEPAFLMNAFGDPAGSIEIEAVRRILGEERLPEGFVRKEVVFKKNMAVVSQKIIATMKVIRDAASASE